MSDTQQYLVSIIIPNYNFGHLIANALESIEAQSYHHYECIIVDDGSIDNSKEIITSFIKNKPKFKSIFQENRGPAAARNAGIKEAKGDFIHFLDADDFLQKDKILHQINIYKKHPQADILYSRALYFSGNEKISNASLPKLEEDGTERPCVTGSGEIMVNAFLKNSICISSALIHKNVIEKIGLLDEKLIQSEDWLFFLKAANAGICFHYHDNTDGTFSLVRTHDSNNTINFWRLQYYGICMRKKFNQICNDPNLIHINYKHIAYACEDLVTEACNTLKTNRKLSIKRFYKNFLISPKIRYLIYFVFSFFLNYNMMKKTTQFSFRKTFE